MRARTIRRLLIAVVLALVASSATVVISETPALAAACSGASCTGRNPQGICNGSDSKTVGAMDVGDGILELRWSPSCVANWGRFTPYTRTEAGLAAAKIGIWARVTVWNPGQPSQGTAYHALGFGESTWSYMTDGNPRACTGVEIFHFYMSDSGSMGDLASQGWWWGPCY